VKNSANGVAGRLSPPGELPPGYFRGAAGALSHRAVVRLASGFLALALAAVAVAMAVQAVADHRRSTALAHHGERIVATVAGCYGMASGTGITAAGFRCSGRFAIDGRNYVETLRGTSALYEVGHTVTVLVDPHDPSSATVLDGRAAPAASWTELGFAAVPLAIAVAALAVASTRRAPRTHGFGPAKPRAASPATEATPT
jgi:hypothetical protein